MKNNKGFTLVEIMIAAAMLAGLAVVGMQLTKSTAKSSSKMNFDTDVTLTTNEINAILSDPQKCLNTLGSTGTPNSIDGKYFISSHASAPTQGYGNAGLKITNYNLTASGTSGTLAILYENKNILKGTSGPTNITKNINLYVEGTVGAITKCRSLSTSSTDIWTRGSSSSIYYNGGNVGVGTITPGYTMQVDGSFGANSNYQGASGASLYTPGSYGQVEIRNVNTNTDLSYLSLHSGGTIAWQHGIQGSTYVISSTGGGSKSNNDSEKIAITSAGNVGIGTTTPTATLEVAGGIKPGAGTTGSACTPEGAFAYDMAAHAPVYCSNIAVWTKFTAASAPVVAPVKAHGVNDGGGGWADNCAPGYSMTGIGVYGNVMYLYCTKF